MRIIFYFKFKVSRTSFYKNEDLAEIYFLPNQLNNYSRMQHLGMEFFKVQKYRTANLTLLFSNNLL